MVVALAKGALIGKRLKRKSQNYVLLSRGFGFHWGHSQEWRSGHSGAPSEPGTPSHAEQTPGTRVRAGSHLISILPAGALAPPQPLRGRLAAGPWQTEKGAGETEAQRDASWSPGSSPRWCPRPISMATTPCMDG